MKLKKLLCLLLSIVMLLSLTACGGDSNADEGGDKEPNKEPTTPTTTVPPEDDAVWVLVQESDMGSSRYTRYIYDETGALVGGEFYDGVKKYGDYNFVTVPNADGSKTVEQWYKHVQESEFSLQRKYTFDKEGRLIRNQACDKAGNLEDFFTTFSYNEQGQLVEQVYTEDGEMYKKLTFVYDGDLLKEGHYEDKNGNYGHYVYTYDENGNPTQIDVHTNYMEEQQYTLILEVENKYAYEIRATEDCHNVVGGRRLFFFEDREDYREVQIKNWGIFHTGWLPLVSFGCLDSGNYFTSSANLRYEPLDVHLAKQAQSE